MTKRCADAHVFMPSVWSQRGFPLVSIRIGLATGMALVGNLGSPERFRYGVGPVRAMPSARSGRAHTQRRRGRADRCEVGMGLLCSYTCVGDVVDSANKMEELNKEFGTYIATTRAMYLKVGAAWHHASGERGL